MPVRDLLSAASGIGAADDPYFYANSLLLNGDGTNGAQNNTFLDSSTNNFTITRNGNTTQGSFSPYGSLWSNYFDGSSDLKTASNVSLGTTYTFEAWVNYSSLATGTNAENSIFGSGAANGIDFGYGGSNGNKWFMAIYGSGFAVQSADTTIQKGVWYHVAWVLSGGTGTIYVNGTSVASGSYSPSSPPTTNIYVGSYGGGGKTNGYISNARYVNGTALYTSNFTPSTTPLTAISGTQLLTCQSNRFIDNSSNNYTLTASGSPQVQRFSPFNPTAPYSTSVIGGSGYFDGSGDYLTVPNNAALQLDSSDFTIGAWVYVTATSGSAQTLIAKGTGSGNQASYVIQLNSSGTWVYNISNNGATWSYSDVPIGTNTLNTWQYIALVRSGNTFTPYLNGVAGTATTASITLFAGTAVLSLGADDTGGNRLTGYISDARVVKGTAIVPSTNPTTPSTAVTNTSFLGNMTNAGIPDLAMQNNLETVGNAQVSTSVKKYGTGSISQPNSGTSDYLYINNNQSLAFGTGDFTIEAWVNSANVSSANQKGWLQLSTVAGGFSGNTNNGLWILFGNPSNGSIQVSINNVDLFISAGISANTWNYITVVRQSGTIYVYLNGVSVATNTNTANLTCTYLVTGYYSSAYPIPGYIDDLRITKGLCRYPNGTTFTPPTAALPTY